MSETAVIRPGPVELVKSEPSLLDDIVSRMSAIEAKAARPAPVKLRTWEEIERFAEKAARSGMVPKDYAGKADAICIAVQMGSELGLAPMQAIQNIAVINGRPSIWGDAMLALCRASGVAAYIREWHEGEGDAMVFYCEARRRDDQTPIRASFSVEDAQRAGLWKTEPKTKKQGRDGPYEVDSGPWYSYPQRMLQMRARGFCLRDAFPDVLKGLITSEEAQDIPWEDTGLPPPIMASPKPPQRAETPPPPSDPLDERNPGKWLINLKAALEAAEDHAEVLRISDHPTVHMTLEQAPTAIKGRVKDMLADAYARTKPTDEPTGEPEA